MAYIDEQGGSDKSRKLDGSSLYSEQEAQLDQKPKSKGENIVEPEPQKPVKKHHEGILTRMRKGLFGDKTLGEKAKEGYKEGKAALAAGSVGGLEDGMAKVVRKLANPKALAGLVMGTGVGMFSLASIFSTYKNDDLIRNDPPLQCEEGDINLPGVAGGAGEGADAQETVNILYDIFVNEFGYTEADLTGMVACMLVETGCDPDRLESDFNLVTEKEVFDSIAGPGTVPTADVAQQAYWNYGESFRSGGGWNGKDTYVVDGNMCPGIGLIQWTGTRANEFIQGLNKVSMDVSPMDVQYQAAYLLAEAQTKYPQWAPGGERTGNGDAIAATTNFFGTMVYGHMPSSGDEELKKRLDMVDQATALVASAAANSEFTMDAVTMAGELAEEGFNTSVAQAQTVQLCVNSSYIITSDIANAAVSISWLERGDYEDVQGAYGSYRRDSRAPSMINDWNFVEGKNEDFNTLGEPDLVLKYSDRRPGSLEPKASWRFYDIDLATSAKGKLDLIACTEYYYFAHMIAFPKETGAADQPGYFSSCDRGTATAVRIAGADDKFPAGNPLYQLSYAMGAKKQGAQHNENARVEGQEAGALWKFSGFMRGSDWYSASGSASIPTGGVMISWGVRAANGLLGSSAAGAATDSGMLSPGDSAEASPEGSTGDNNYEDDSAPGVGSTGWNSRAIQLACLRYPMSVANTTRHIITYVGDGTVQGFWGLEWLYKQWQNYDDADRLIRKDLTETVPEVMSKGLSFKQSYAVDSGDQHMTFYKAKARGAYYGGGHEDEKEFEPLNGRKVEFNSKTGLPEFKAWEQIYVRLIHNSDDDAALDASGNQLFEEIEPFGNLTGGASDQGDGYLDLVEESELDSKIEQYDNEKTYHNKYFYEDWNSLGVPHIYDTVDDHTQDYKMPSGTLIWRDKSSISDPLQWTHETGAVRSEMWRYELVTDIEYRMNQFLRFGMASLMCSYPSEEDADVFQTGGEGNATGHILGNLYRRFSRIPDKVDTSGRYYYYNTVVSNDMLQDLVQLYSEEKNAWATGGKYDASGGEGKNERNFGPMYLVRLNRVYDDAMGATSSSAQWVDRRYGLTAYDIAYIANGIDGAKMGEIDKNGAEEAFRNIITEPMHKLTNVDTAWLSLYNNGAGMNSISRSVNGAHEPVHEYNDADGVRPYETEIYGMNPFLMLEREALLDVDETEANRLVWDATGDPNVSVRNDLEGALTGKPGNGSGDKAMGITPTDTSGHADARLAWIDRHYFVTKNGAIGTFAYQVLALNPSTGSKVTAGNYADKLKSSETLVAGHEGQSYEDMKSLYGSWGLVQYTDYIYGDGQDESEAKENNRYMAKRLFAGDDRNGDDPQSVDGARDDYNRREYLVIPYYHTHAQQCSHAAINNGYGEAHYKLLCRWQNNDVTPDVGITDNMTIKTNSMIDTQVALNGNDGTNYQGDRGSGKSCGHLYTNDYDYGDTISFLQHVENREKYALEEQLVSAMEKNDIRIFADTGDEIAWNAKPYIHVTCDGVTISPCCPGTEDCEECKWYHDPPSTTEDKFICTTEEHTSHSSGCYSDKLDCSTSEHSHGDDCYDKDKNLTCTEEEHSHDDSCYKSELTCTKTLHTHSSSCYKCEGHNPDCSPSGAGCPDSCSKCHKKCPVCDKDMACGESHHHPCSEGDDSCIAYGYCHDHKECDDYGSTVHGSDVVAGCATGWHGDGGEVDYYYQTDKCHYEYGCNALEFLYHNDGMYPDADGMRMHYRWIDPADEEKYGLPTVYDPTRMELFEVHALYMAMPAASGVDMKAFNITDWMTDGALEVNDSVIPDKANLMQQVQYDVNGWVKGSWQALASNSDGSLIKPRKDSAYTDYVKSNIKGIETITRSMTVGYADKTDPANPHGLIQYFTIEGNSIHRTSNWDAYKSTMMDLYGKFQSEYTNLYKAPNGTILTGTPDDLVALEPIRNRVGYGKSVPDQTISIQGTTQRIDQSDGPGASSTQPVIYDSSWHNEATDAFEVVTGNGNGLGSHGFGEVDVVGTQHPKEVTDGLNYGDYTVDPSVTGPDGSKGNGLSGISRSSLLREIIGDEHVVHVKFDTQDWNGLKGLSGSGGYLDPRTQLDDNGRDFMFYVDKKEAYYDNIEQGGKYWPVDLSESDITPDMYQNPDSQYYKDHLDKFKDNGSVDSGANRYGTFKKMDMDTLYQNYYTGELTDKMYAENVYPYNATDEKVSEGSSKPNMVNPRAKAVTSNPDGAVNGGDAMGLITSHKERGRIDNADGNGNTNTGDYRNWVTHASRGHRGMMTQYLNFGTFFKDVYKAGDRGAQDNTNAYMVFENVNRSDVKRTEPGGEDKYGYQMGSDDADAAHDREPTTKEEGFVYKTPPGDAIIEKPTVSWGYGDSAGFSDTYGQGSNSHWKNMMDLYNAAMSETRQYGY